MLSKRGVVCLAAALTASACATRGLVPTSPESRGPAAVTRTQPPADSLETFIGKVREVSVRARPPVSSAQTVEASDPALAVALFAVGVSPTPANHRIVAREYVRLGILDKAHEHFSAAVAIDPRDAAAWDGLARIWRDWGLPHLALPDAHRAAYFAPSSPVVHNTLGSVLQALGKHREARNAYEIALRLDAEAAYALNNLCYSLLVDGYVAQAISACERAVQIDPTAQATLNNLGLAYAAAGRFAEAKRTFGGAVEPGRAEYNLGLAHLTRGEYRDAVNAFQAAQTLRPGFRAAAVMARHAQQQAIERSNP